MMIIIKHKTLTSNFKTNTGWIRKNGEEKGGKIK